MQQLLTDYPVITEIPVAWGEMDAFAHVNNTVYIRYFETGRASYFERLQIFTEMMKTGIGPILASVYCRFKLPLTYPDTVSVGVRVTSIEADRYTVEHRVVSHRHRRIAAYGDGLIVNYDFRSNRKTPLSRELIEAIKKLEATRAKVSTE